MGRPLKDLSGKRFGRWTVLARNAAPEHAGAGVHPKWVCVCDCGAFGCVFGTLLVVGKSGSCGCLHRERVVARNTTHGEYGTKHYWNWFGAQKRAKKFKATPPWADLEKVRAIYRARPAGQHVDHIVPLNSPIVCGLHWEGNLQYLPARDNMSKKNKLLETA